MERLRAGIRPMRARAATESVVRGSRDLPSEAGRPEAYEVEGVEPPPPDYPAPGSPAERAPGLARRAATAVSAGVRNVADALRRADQAVDEKVYDPYVRPTVDRIDQFGANVVRGATQIASDLPKAAGIAQAGIDQRLAEAGAGEYSQEIRERVWQENPELAELAENPGSQEGYEALKRLDALAKFHEMRADPARETADARDRWLFRMGDRIQESVESRLPEQDPADADSWLWSKFPRALGTGLGFMGAGGGVGLGVRAATRGPLRGMTAATVGDVAGITSAGLGGSVGASTQYEDALRAGADEQTARLAAAMGFGPGMLEAIPVVQAINRFSPRIVPAMQGLLKQNVTAGTLGAVEEAIQESIQTVGENAIAQTLYDKDRELGEGLFDAGTTGGAVGFLFSFMSSMAGVRIRAIDYSHTDPRTGDTIGIPEGMFAARGQRGAEDPIPGVGPGELEAYEEGQPYDPYGVLGVSHVAPDEVISQVYRQRAARVHPDVNSDPKANATFKNLAEAHEYIMAVRELQAQRQAEADKPPEPEPQPAAEAEPTPTPQEEPDARPQEEPGETPDGATLETEEVATDQEAGDAQGQEEAADVTPPLEGRGERMARTPTTVELTQTDDAGTTTTTRQEVFEERYDDGSVVRRNQAGEVVSDQPPPKPEPAPEPEPEPVAETPTAEEVEKIATDEKIASEGEIASEEAAPAPTPETTALAERLQETDRRIREHGITAEAEAGGILPEDAADRIADLQADFITGDEAQYKRIASELDDLDRNIASAPEAVVEESEAEPATMQEAVEKTISDMGVTADVEVHDLGDGAQQITIKPPGQRVAEPEQADEADVTSIADARAKRDERGFDQLDDGMWAPDEMLAEEIAEELAADYAREGLPVRDRNEAVNLVIESMRYRTEAEARAGIDKWFEAQEAPSQEADVIPITGTPAIAPDEAEQVAKPTLEAGQTVYLAKDLTENLPKEWTRSAPVIVEEVHETGDFATVSMDGVEYELEIENLRDTPTDQYLEEQGQKTILGAVPPEPPAEPAEPVQFGEPHTTPDDFERVEITADGERVGQIMHRPDSPYSWEYLHDRTAQLELSINTSQTGTLDEMKAMVRNAYREFGTRERPDRQPPPPEPEPTPEPEAEPEPEPEPEATQPAAEPEPEPEFTPTHTTAQGDPVEIRAQHGGVVDVVDRKGEEWATTLRSLTEIVAEPAEEPKAPLPATPKKLSGKGRDAVWGARVADPGVKVADLIEVKTKKGKTWTSKVTEIVSTASDHAIVKVQRLDDKGRPDVSGLRFTKKSWTKEQFSREVSHVEFGGKRIGRVQSESLGGGVWHPDEQLATALHLKSVNLGGAYYVTKLENDRWVWPSVDGPRNVTAAKALVKDRLNELAAMEVEPDAVPPARESPDAPEPEEPEDGVRAEPEDRERPADRREDERDASVPEREGEGVQEGVEPAGEEVAPKDVEGPSRTPSGQVPRERPARPNNLTAEEASDPAPEPMPLHTVVERTPEERMTEYADALRRLDSEYAKGADYVEAADKILRMAERLGGTAQARYYGDAMNEAAVGIIEQNMDVASTVEAQHFMGALFGEQGVQFFNQVAGYLETQVAQRALQENHPDTMREGDSPFGAASPFSGNPFANAPAHIRDQYEERKAARQEESLPDPQQEIASENFPLTREHLATLGGPITRARRNLRIIQLVKEIVAADRKATNEEQAEIAKYVGWGGLKRIFQTWGYGGDAHTWRDLNRQLKQILTEAEYRTAETSILNAHYTTPEVVTAMYRALDRFGVQGYTRKLEAGAGVGNFIGMSQLPQGPWTAVEMDKLSSNILETLYPQATVLSQRYEDTPIADDSFDIAIGNPPFGDIPITYRDQKSYQIHDFFILKSLDALRPGGILAYVTSTGTLDKLSLRPRRALEDRANFLGAIKLPNDAFASAAGTQVTTDIVFFQKRPDDMTPRHRGEWIHTRNVTQDVEVVARTGGKLPTDRGAIYRINQWFADNPQYMLGTMEASTMYRDPDKEKVGSALVPSLKAREGVDLAEALTNAIDELTREANETYVNAATARQVEERVADEIPLTGIQSLAPGQFTVRTRKGKPMVLRRLGNKLVPAAAMANSKKHQERIMALIKLNDAARTVINVTRNWQDETVLKRKQGILKKHYDAFVAKWGSPNKVEFNTVEKWISAKKYEKDHGAVPPDAETRKHKVRGVRITQVKTLDEVRSWPNLLHYRDPTNGLIRTLDYYDKESGEYKLGDIFSTRLHGEPEEVEAVETAHEALVLSLQKHGHPDIKFMAQKAGMSENRVLRDLQGTIFREPVKRKWVLASTYLGGDVRLKLATAQAAAEQDPQYKPNVEALEKVIPEAVPAVIIREAGGARLGNTWIPNNAYMAFTHFALGFNSTIKFRAADGKWSVTGISQHNAAVYGEWVVEDGDKGGTTNQIFERLINSVPQRVVDIHYDGEGNKHETLHRDATQAAERVAKRMQSRFERWLFEEDPHRSVRMANIWNERMNRWAPQSWDGTHLRGAIPGLTEKLHGDDFDFRDLQLDAAWRYLESGNTLLHWVTGGGKTYVMALIAMMSRRLGVARKPIIFVPNAIHEQFVGEFKEIFPSAKILASTAELMKQSKVKPKKTGDPIEYKPSPDRQAFLAEAATGDYDAIIMTRSQFTSLPFSPETETEVVEGMIDEFREMLDELRGDNAPRQSIRQVQKTLETFRQRQRVLMSTQRKEDSFFFEDLGADLLIVDEAHEFKNLSLPSRTGRGAGSMNPSKRATKMYMATRHMQKVNPERGIVFSTATPISNKMDEAYYFLRYLMPENELRRLGYGTLNAFRRSFVASWPELEYDITARYELRQGERAWMNVYQLLLLWKQTADVVRKGDLRGVTVPQLVGPAGQPREAPEIASSEYGPGGEADPRAVRFARHNLRRLQDTIQEMRDGTPVEELPDPIFAILSDGLKASLDARLVTNDIALEALDNTRPFQKPKLEVIAEIVTEFLEETAEHRATVMIFSDKGVGQIGYKGFSFYDALRDRLLEMGVPEDEIKYIRDAKDQYEKQEMVNQLNRGEIRVLLGTSQNMGTGVNAQRRLGLKIDAYYPWKPSELQQSDGRILRQGNKLVEEGKLPGVRIVRAVTPASADAFLLQKIENKINPIEQFVNATPESTMITVEGGSSMGDQIAAVKSMAAANPYAQQRVRLIAQRKQLESESRQHLLRSERRLRELTRHEDHLKDLKQNRPWAKHDDTEIRKVVQSATPGPRGDTINQRKARAKGEEVDRPPSARDVNLVIGGKEYESNIEANAELSRIWRKMRLDKRGKIREGRQIKIVGSVGELGIQISHYQHFGESFGSVRLIGVYPDSRPTHTRSLGRSDTISFFPKEHTRTNKKGEKIEYAPRSAARAVQTFLGDSMNRLASHDGRITAAEVQVKGLKQDIGEYPGKAELLELDRAIEDIQQKYEEAEQEPPPELPIPMADYKDQSVVPPVPARLTKDASGFPAGTQVEVFSIISRNSEKYPGFVSVREPNTDEMFAVRRPFLDVLDDPDIESPRGTWSYRRDAEMFPDRKEHSKDAMVKYGSVEAQVEVSRGVARRAGKLAVFSGPMVKIRNEFSDFKDTFSKSATTSVAVATTIAPSAVTGLMIGLGHPGAVPSLAIHAGIFVAGLVPLIATHVRKVAKANRRLFPNTGAWREDVFSREPTDLDFARAAIREVENLGEELTFTKKERKAFLKEHDAKEGGDNLFDHTLNAVNQLVWRQVVQDTNMLEYEPLNQLVSPKEDVSPFYANPSPRGRPLSKTAKEGIAEMGLRSYAAGYEAYRLVDNVQTAFRSMRLALNYRSAIKEITGVRPRPLHKDPFHRIKDAYNRVDRRAIAPLYSEAELRESAALVEQRIREDFPWYIRDHEQGVKDKRKALTSFEELDMAFRALEQEVEARGVDIMEMPAPMNDPFAFTSKRVSTWTHEDQTNPEVRRALVEGTSKSLYGWVDAIGQKLRGPEEMFRFMREFARSKTQEIAHFVGTTEDGTVRLVRSLSSGALDYVSGSRHQYYAISRAIREKGVANLYLIHNHPTGIARPSGGDVGIHKMYTTLVEAHHPDVKVTSMVIDSNTFAVMDENHARADQMNPVGGQTYEAQTLEDLPGEPGYERISHPADAAAMMAKLSRNPNTMQFMFLDTQNHVVALEPVPWTYRFDKADIEKRIRELGAARLVIGVQSDAWVDDVMDQAEAAGLADPWLASNYTVADVLNINRSEFDPKKRRLLQLTAELETERVNASPLFQMLRSPRPPQWDPARAQTEHGDVRKGGQKPLDRAERIRTAYGRLDAFRTANEDRFKEELDAETKAEGLRLLRDYAVVKQTQQVMSTAEGAKTVGQLMRAVSQMRVTFMGEMRKISRRQLRYALKGANIGKMHPDFIKRMRELLGPYKYGNLVDADARRKLGKPGGLSLIRLADLERLRKEVMKIDHDHRHRRGELLGARQEILGKVADRVIAETNKRVPDPLPEGPHISQVAAALTGAQPMAKRHELGFIGKWFMIQGMRPASIMHWLSPTLRQIVYDDVSVKAHDLELDRRQRHEEAIQAASEKAAKAETGTRAFRAWASKVFRFQEEGVDIEVAREELMDMQGTFMDPQNAALAFKNGIEIDYPPRQLRSVPPEAIGAFREFVNETLSEQDRAVTESMFARYNNEMPVHLDDALVEARGYGLDRVMSYWPRKVDPRENAEGEIVPEKDPMVLLTRLNDPDVATWGPLRKRVGTSRPLRITSAFARYNHHAAHAARISSYLVPTLNAHAVLNSVRPTIESRIGREGFERLRESVELQTIKYYDRTPMKRRIRSLHGRMATSILGWRLTTLAAVPAGVAVTVGYDAITGEGAKAWSRLRKAVARATIKDEEGNLRVSLSEFRRIERVATLHSPYWRERYGHSFASQYVAGLTDAGGVIGDWFMHPLQWTERKIAGVLRWLMAEMKVADKNPELEAESAEYFKQVSHEFLRMTVNGDNSANGGDLNGMLAMGRRDPWALSFVMFRSASSKQGDLAILAALLAQGKTTPKSQIMSGVTGLLASLSYMAFFVRMLTRGLLAGTISLATLAALMRFDDEEDDVLSLKEFLVYSSLEFLDSTIPYVGQLMRPGVNYLAGRGAPVYPVSGLEDVAGEVAWTFVDLAQLMKSLVTEEADTKEEVVDLIQGLATLASLRTGIPLEGPTDLFSAFIPEAPLDPIDELESERRGASRVAATARAKVLDAIESDNDLLFREGHAELMAAGDTLRDDGDLRTVVNRKGAYSRLTKYEPGKPDREGLTQDQLYAIDLALYEREQVRRAAQAMGARNRDLIASELLLEPPRPPRPPRRPSR